MHTNIVHDRSRETFSSHIWILTKLLLQSQPIDEFLLYVVAACHRKILSRMKNQISKQYLKSLLEANETLQFREVPRPEQETITSRAQQQYDYRLLSSLSKLSIKADIPRLKKLAKKAAHEKSGLSQYTLYTQDTFLEFHLLICELLESFNAALLSIMALTIY